MIRRVWKTLRAAGYLTGRAHSLAYTGVRHLKWLSGDRSPICASMKITARCNLECSFCPWVEDRSGDLPLERWRKLIEEVHMLGVRRLVFEGGEPTLRDDLQEMVDSAHAANMDVTIATNGTRSLAGYSPDRFFISVDGLEDVHDSLRGKGTTQKLLKNIKTTEVEKVAIVSVSMRNFHQIEKILGHYGRLFDGFWFSFIYDYDGRNKIMLNTSQKREAARRILSLSNKYPVINRQSYLRSVGNNRRCRDWLLCTVTSNGEIHRGCIIRESGSCNHEQCELACYREYSDVIEKQFALHHLPGFNK